MTTPLEISPESIRESIQKFEELRKRDPEKMQNAVRKAAKAAGERIAAQALAHMAEQHIKRLEPRIHVPRSAAKLFLLREIR